MVQFEFLKLGKNRTLILLILFALVMACVGVFLQQKTENKKMFQEAAFEDNPEFLYTSFQSLDLALSTMKEMTIDFQRAGDENDLLLLQTLKTYAPGDPYFRAKYQEYIAAKKDNFYAMKDVFDHYAKEYPEVLDDDDVQKKLANVAWLNKKYDLILQNGSMDPYSTIYKEGDNAVQRILFRGDFLFGIIPLLFFLLIFSGFYSQEREKGNYVMLYTGGNGHRRIVLAKILVLFCALVLYTVLVSVFFLGLQSVRGIPLAGFLDPYRVFSTDPSGFMFGWKILLLQGVQFIFVSLFFLLVLFFLSTVLGTKRSFACILLIFSLFFVGKRLLPFMPNPIVHLNAFLSFLGHYYLKTNSSGITTEVLRYATPIYIVFIYPVIDLLLLVLCLPKREPIAAGKRTARFPVSGLLSFEMKKILSFEPYGIYLLLFAMLFASYFIADRRTDLATVREISPDSGNEYESYKYSMDETKAIYDEYKNPVDDNGKPVDIATLSDWAQGVYASTLESYEETYLNAKAELENYVQFARHFQQGTSEEYYNAVLEQYRQQVEGSGSHYYVYPFLVLEAPSRESIEMTKAVMAQAAARGVHKMPFVWPYLSAREEYREGESIEMHTANDDAFRSHSGPYWLFKNIRARNLALIVLGLVLLITTAGYTVDGNRHSALGLIYTQPLSRSRYLLGKIAAACLVSAVLVSLLFTGILLPGMVTEGMGTMQMPVITYTPTSFELVPMWQYLLKVYISVLLGAFFLVSLMILFSLFIRKRELCLALGFGVSLFGIYGAQGLPCVFKVWNPFMYLKGNILSDQSISIIANTGFISFWMGLLVLLVWSAVNILLSFAVVRLQKNVA